MLIRLAYGRSFLPVELPDAETTVIEPTPESPLPHERAALIAALENPIGAPPLRDSLHPGCRVCIVHTDITRATPNERLIPWLLDYLHNSGVASDQITLLNGTGTHRPNTRDELEEMLTPAVVAGYRCVNHECEDATSLAPFGSTRSGAPALLNRHLAEADVRIITGFIEPHFFAGFSGGPKGIMPGVAGLATVQSNHGAGPIGDPRATFGVTEGNPLWEEMREIALRVGPSFLLNVTLNEERAITGVFAGDLIVAHRAGCDFVRRSAMQPQSAPYDIVLTTNSGYPLDMNLYQAVKGMRAAELIVRDGGLIIMAAECCEGVPDGSPHDRLLRATTSPEDILQKIADPAFAWPEQWQSQIQSLIQRRAEIHLHSALADSTVRAAHLIPCSDIAALIRARLKPGQRLAVLPQGPLTIPYLKTSATHAPPSS
jgi:nickel-dependent lactate racemase